ncbi:MAG TPA: vanadium-dependent haloperoxidase [Terriglobales bacterium]|nr:vanadium-dependent haloperoxidase [Terriglobales bacterium]
MKAGLRCGLSSMLAVLLLSCLAVAQNAVADWDAIALNTIVSVAKKGPPTGTVYFAYESLAVYDAVNAIDGRYTPFAVPYKASPNASKDAAAAAAAHDVLVHYFQAQKGDLDKALAASLAAIPDGPAKDEGVQVGQAVAAAWIAIRANDGIEAPIVYVPGHGPGIWEPVPPSFPPPVAPWMAQMVPFTLASPSQFLPSDGPPPLNSEEWAFNYNLTKIFGAKNSSVRTPRQTDIGLFWSDNTITQYSNSWRKLAAQQHLGTADTARLFAIVDLAVADSLIACFNAKYHFAFWRPVTAIRAGDTDGNLDTIADPNWEPLAPTPGHPEYPAAHGCYTAAAMDVLAHFFGTDRVEYSVDSAVTHNAHSFHSFQDVVAEVDLARIFGGMHYLHSVLDGNNIGRKVARHITRNYFLPAGHQVDENQQ